MKQDDCKSDRLYILGFDFLSDILTQFNYMVVAKLMTKTNNVYKLSMAEFKGQVLADLGTIKGDIKEVKKDLSKKACKEDVTDLKKQISNIKLTSVVIGAIGGIATSVAVIFGFKRI